MRKYLVSAALLSAATVSVMGATPALAQEEARTGTFHVEGIVGYDAPDNDADASGVVYGIAGGYDFNLGRAFAGPEVEVSTSSAGDCATGINRASDQLCLDAGRDLYVGARLGIRVGERGRLYVGGGYTNARFRATYDANLAGNTGDFNITDDADGYRLKAGGEYDIGSNMFVRAEYRYSNYSDLDLDRHQVVGAVGFRF